MRIDVIFESMLAARISSITFSLDKERTISKPIHSIDIIEYKMAHKDSLQNPCDSINPIE